MNSFMFATDVLLFGKRLLFESHCRQHLGERRGSTGWVASISLLRRGSNGSDQGLDELFNANCTLFEIRFARNWIERSKRYQVGVCFREMKGHEHLSRRNDP